MPTSSMKTAWLALLGALACATPAPGQDFPTRTVRMKPITDEKLARRNVTAALPPLQAPRRAPVPAPARPVPVHAATHPDPFPGVILQAMAVDTAVVVPDVGGAREQVVDGV